MMDLNANGDSSPQPNCSICLEPVGDQRARSIAKLICGHDFHLDCIGSAFNAKGIMQCPNCRKVERGQWLFPSGPHHNNSSSEDLEWLGDEIYDVTFSDVPFGIHWCPVPGLTHISSVIESSLSRLLRMLFVQTISIHCFPCKQGGTDFNFCTFSVDRNGRTIF